MHPRSLLAATLLLPAWACASLPPGLRLLPPTVELERIRITGLGLSGGTLALDLTVTNPNAFTIRTTRIEAQVDLEETRFADIALERGLTLEAESSNAVELPVAFTWSGAGAGARGVLEKGSVQYGLTVRLFLVTPIGDRMVTASQDGVVPVQALLR